MKHKYFLRKGKKKAQYDVFLQPKSSEGKFYYTYSYQYSWVKGLENSIERCYLNEVDYLELTDRHLKIFQHNHFKLWEKVENIKQIHISFKRLMLPVVIGGITAPLALVALFTQIFTLWTGFAMTFIGLLLLYYGMRGGYQLQIESINNQMTLFIDEKNPAIEKLIVAFRYLKYQY